MRNTEIWSCVKEIIESELFNIITVQNASRQLLKEVQFRNLNVTLPDTLISKYIADLTKNLIEVAKEILYEFISISVENREC